MSVLFISGARQEEPPLEVMELRRCSASLPARVTSILHAGLAVRFDLLRDGAKKRSFFYAANLNLDFPTGDGCVPQMAVNKWTTDCDMYTAGRRHPQRFRGRLDSTLLCACACVRACVQAEGTTGALKKANKQKGTEKKSTAILSSQQRRCILNSTPAK